MKIIYCLICSILFCNICFSQNIPTDTSAPVVAYWKKGDKKNFVITKTIERTKDGKIITSNTHSYGASLRVIDSTKEHYTIEWIYKNLPGQKKLQIQGFQDIMDNLKVIYKTDDVGSFAELVNYDEIKKFVDNMIGMFLKDIKDSIALGMVINETKQIFSSRESVEELLLRDISLYHSIYGGEYTRTKVMAETELPNFLGGDPWPAVITVKLVKLKPAEDFAQVHMTLEVDKTKAAEIIKKYVTKIAASTGKEIPVDEMPSYVEINDQSEFDIILSTGWIKRAYMKRIGGTGNSNKTEIMTIELKN